MIYKKPLRLLLQSRALKVNLSLGRQTALLVIFAKHEISTNINIYYYIYLIY